MIARNGRKQQLAYPTPRRVGRSVSYIKNTSCIERGPSSMVDDESGQRWASGGAGEKFE